MCHPDAPVGLSPHGAVPEVGVALASGEEMPGLLVPPPAGDGVAPSVLVIPDMFGRSPFYEDLAHRLAAAGFTALLVEYFFRQGPLATRSHDAAFARRRELDENQTLEDLREAARWLRQRDGGPTHVGTVGFCMGGTFALDLTALEPDLVTVAYYGFPVPQPTLAFPPPAPDDLADRLQGPILAFWGDQDDTVGINNVRRFVARMGQVDNPDFSYRIFEGVGHGFAGAELDQADEPTREAVVQSWEATLRHLGSHLGRHPDAAGAS